MLSAPEKAPKDWRTGTSRGVAESPSVFIAAPAIWTVQAGRGFGAGPRQIEQALTVSAPARQASPDPRSLVCATDRCCFSEKNSAATHPTRPQG